MRFINFLLRGHRAVWWGVKGNGYHEHYSSRAWIFLQWVLGHHEQSSRCLCAFPRLLYSSFINLLGGFYSIYTLRALAWIFHSFRNIIISWSCDSTPCLFQVFVHCQLLSPPALPKRRVTISYLPFCWGIALLVSFPTFIRLTNCFMFTTSQFMVCLDLHRTVALKHEDFNGGGVSGRWSPRLFTVSAKSVDHHLWAEFLLAGFSSSWTF